MTACWKISSWLCPSFHPRPWSDEGAQLSFKLGDAGTCRDQVPGRFYIILLQVKETAVLEPLPAALQSTAPPRTRRMNTAYRSP